MAEEPQCCYVLERAAIRRDQGVLGPHSNTGHGGSATHGWCRVLLKAWSLWGGGSKRRPPTGTLLHPLPRTRGSGITEAGTRQVGTLHGFRSPLVPASPCGSVSLQFSIPVKLGHKRPLELCIAESVVLGPLWLTIKALPRVPSPVLEKKLTQYHGGMKLCAVWMCVWERESLRVWKMFTSKLSVVI